MIRTEIQQEVVDLITFYEKRGWDWANAAEFTLSRASGRLEYVIRPRIGFGRPRNSEKKRREKGGKP